MNHVEPTSVRASVIAAFLELPLEGCDVRVRCGRPLLDPMPGALTFSTGTSIPDDVALQGVAVIGPPGLTVPHDGCLIVSDSPRLDFARAIAQFLTPPHPTGVAASARVGQNVHIADSAFIGEYSVLEDDVVVGQNSRIHHHVVLARGTKVGSDCVVQSHAVIGEQGFGYELDPEGVPFHIPHSGSVTIGDRVHIGASTVIARGTLDDTVVHDDVKIDDHVFIAHNAEIGERSMVIAGSEISGSVVIGTDVWIAPLVTIMNKVNVGNHAFIGIGSVVLKDVPPNTVVVGNPARVIRVNAEPSS